MNSFARKKKKYLKKFLKKQTILITDPKRDLLKKMEEYDNIKKKQ